MRGVSPSPIWPTSTTSKFGLAVSCGYNCSISTRLPQLLHRALFFGNRMSPKCVACGGRSTVMLVEPLPDPPLLSVTEAVTVTCLDCGRLRSALKETEAELN